MDERDWLAERFEENRGHLRAVAYRILGSLSEADDAVQEAWLRLSRSEMNGIENLRGWLTTVVARLCLDMLRARTSRREESLGQHAPEPAVKSETQRDPEQEAVLADSVGLALLVVLDRLAPAERLSHHMQGIKAARLVHRYGIRLLPELYEWLNPMPFEAAAQMEQDLAEDLRRQGYTVAGGH